MARLWKRFTIMNRNRRVASIREDGTCTIYLPRMLPYNIYLEKVENIKDIDTRLNNLENFYHWCSSRVLTLDRKYAKEIFNSLHQKQSITDRERANIAIAYHGVSFVDTYWIKGNRERVNFKDINLYTHSLSDSFVDVSLRGKQLTAQNTELINPLDVAGDLSTVGVAPKAWVCRDGIFYLLKGGSKDEVEAELLASKIANCFNVNHVNYEPDYYDGEKVSKCRIITSLKKSIIPIEYIQIYAQNRGFDYLEYVLEKDKYNYHMMNIIDYLVGNIDRHWGNWGFEINNDNNKPEKLYSLMDFNKSFNAYDNIEGSSCQTTKDNISQKEAAIIAVKEIGLNQISEINRCWFNNPNDWEMFNKRLNILKNIK
ncbi:MAG: hypothetical protein MSH40_02940 [Christensenella sp.]|nr:hypothetical protein [Christensenella sp.]